MVFHSGDRTNPASMRGVTFFQVFIILVVLFFLAAVILPSLDFEGSPARVAAQRSACLENLKQIGAELKMYASEMDGMYGVRPPNGPVSSLFDDGSGVISDMAVFDCPLRKEPVHPMGDYLRDTRWDATDMMPTKVIVGDERMNHGGDDYNFLFRDGGAVSSRTSDNVVGAFDLTDDMDTPDPGGTTPHTHLDVRD